MKALAIIILCSICLTAAVGQTSTPRKIPLTSYSYIDVDTEERYVETGGKGVIIRNSYPKGGPYTSSDGTQFGYRVFWTHIINETRIPLDLTINFSADSVANSNSPDHYFKIFLPSDTMTLEKQYLYDYGATGVKAFLDRNVSTPTTLQHTIKPKQEFLFYTLVLLHQAGGAVRTGFVLKDQQLYYRINGVEPKPDVELIPCGQLIFRNKKIKH